MEYLEMVLKLKSIYIYENEYRMKIRDKGKRKLKKKVKYLTNQIYKENQCN